MIMQALNNYAATLDKDWSHDRSQTVGASEIGQCLRKTFWSKNEGDPNFGVARDPEYVDGWGGKIRGTVYENEFWVPAIKAAYGENALYVGKDQRTFINSFLSGTPDGLIINQKPDALAHLGVADIEGDCIDLDCKTADPRTNLDEAKPEHVYQIHVQLGLIRETTDYKPTCAVLSYTDASFWDVVLEFPIKFDPKVYAAAKARASQIMTATNAADLKPEGWIAGGRECEYCPFTKACGVQRRSVPETNAAADPQFVAEAADLALAIKHAERRRDAFDQEARSLQDDLKTRLREKGVRKIPGVVSWSSIKGRETYDNKAIREAAAEAGVDVESMKNTGEPTDRLTISVKPSISEGAEAQAAHAA